MEIEVSMQVFDYRSFVSLPTGDLPQKRCMQQTVIISYTLLKTIEPTNDKSNTNSYQHNSSCTLLFLFYNYYNNKNRFFHNRTRGHCESCNTTRMNTEFAILLRKNTMNIHSL